MKRFNVLCSLILLAGFTCSDDLFASKKRKKTSFGVKKSSRKKKVNSDEKVQLPKFTFNTQDKDGNTRLHLAVLAGNENEIKYFIFHDARINLENNDKKTPLDLANENKQIAAAKLLKQHEELFMHYSKSTIKKTKVAIPAGTYVNTKDKNGLTPLHVAAEWGHEDFVQLLLHNDADVNAQNERGITPLHMAAHGGHPSIVQLLLDAKAHINFCNERNETPLHVAAKEGNVDAFNLLLAAGADNRILDQNGETPSQLLDQSISEDLMATKLDESSA